MKVDCKSTEGMTRQYCSYFYDGVSLSHAVLAWNYDDEVFDCLAPNKFENPNLSEDLLDKRSDPMSLHKWFKQLGDRQEFAFEY